MPPQSKSAIDPLNTKIDAVEKLVNVKFDAVDQRMEALTRALDRVVAAIEKQAEQNAAVMVLASRFDSHLEGFSSHKVATVAALTAHSKRLDAVEKKASHTAWSFNHARALALAVSTGILSLIVACLDHISEIANFFHGG